MRFGLLATIALAVALVSSPASAQQTSTGLPSERELNRLGLTLSWWSQAGLRTNQDAVSHFWNDEQCVYLQTSLGTIITFDGESGKRIWTRLVGSPFEASLVGTSNETEVLVVAGTDIYSFDKIRGQLRWSFPIPSFPTSSPRADFGVLYFSGMDGMMRAYDTEMLSSLFAQGKLPASAGRAQLWHYQMPSGSTSEAYPMPDATIFTSDAGFVYRVNGRDLNIAFKSELNSKISAPVVYSKNATIISQQNARMVSVNNVKGEVNWVTTSGTPLTSQPFLIDQAFYISAPRDGVSKLSTQTGLRTWRQAKSQAILAISDTRVYTIDNHSNLLILDVTNGQILGQLPLGDFKTRVSNHRTDRIFLANSRGTVISIRELDSQFPAYHLYPERRPILPEFAEEEESVQF